jgi:plastocyanin
MPLMHWKSWILALALAPVASRRELPARDKEPAVEVLVRTFAFRPDTLRIRTGTTVTWTNGDEIEHTVTTDSSSSSRVASEPLRGSLGEKGASYSFTFATPGTYAYLCLQHRFIRGIIHVTSTGEHR